MKKNALLQKVLQVRELTLVLIIIISSVILSILSKYFFSMSNALIILNGMSLNMIVATGVTISLIGGLIDFSVGSILGCASFTTAQLLSRDLPIFICILGGLVVGIILGLINGLIVTKLKVAPIVTTIGTWMAFKGLGIIIIGGASIANFPKEFKHIAQEWNLFGIPFNILVMIIVVVVGVWLLRKVQFFHQAFFVGGNPDSAKLVGINVNKFTLIMYAINGFLSGIAGVLMISRLGSAPATTGQGVEFSIITALLIGGISFNGGAGSILGAFLGTLMMGIISNALALFSISADAQLLIIGFILIFAVAIDEYSRRRQLK